MNPIFLWLAMEAAIADKQVCLPAPSGKQWVCMPPSEVAAWKAEHPETAQATRPPIVSRNQAATTAGNQKHFNAPVRRQATTMPAVVTPVPTSPVPVTHKTQPRATPPVTPQVRRSSVAKQSLDQDAAIRLLYKAPVTLPGQGTHLRRAPTTLEELQGKPAPPKRPVTSMTTREPPKTLQAKPKPTERRTAPSAAKPVYQWQVRLLGSAVPGKLETLLQSLPAALQPCQLYSRPLGELPWQELRCGQFRTRGEAQQWAEQNRTVFPDDSLPTVVRILP